MRDSDSFNQDVLDSCIENFTDMIKFYQIEYKEPFFKELSSFLAESSAPTIPVLKLITKVISDHNVREKIMKKSSSKYNNSSADNYGNVPKWVNAGSSEEPDPVEILTVLDSM